MGLDSPIQVADSHRELSRKLAVMKAVLRKVKILVIKDTPWFVAGRSIVEILKNHGLKSTTIIGITSDLSGCEGAERLVYLEKFRIIEDSKV